MVEPGAEPGCCASANSATSSAMAVEPSHKIAIARSSLDARALMRTDLLLMTQQSTHG
jgi:hypothetical protein